MNREQRVGSVWRRHAAAIFALGALGAIVSQGCVRMNPLYGGHDDSGPDRTIALRGFDRLVRLERELNLATAAPEPPRCERACALAEEICQLSWKICSIAKRNEGDSELAESCESSGARCLRARAKVERCSCGRVRVREGVPPK